MIQVITLDIVDSTSLSKKDKTRLLHDVGLFLSSLKIRKHYIYRGDSMQMQVPKNISAVEVALQIRLFFKTYSLSKQLQLLDCRIALGINTTNANTNKNIAEDDNEAFRISGRALDKLDKKIRIAMVSTNESINDELGLLSLILDDFISETTKAQAHVLQLALQGYNQSDIAQLLDISQSAVAQHLRASKFGLMLAIVKRINAIIS